MPKLVWAFVAVAGATFFGGCDDPVSDIGVKLNDSGDLAILYDPCKENRLVKSVELEAAGGRVLWRIESESGSPLREFVVGVEPEGFSTKVPLSADLGRLRLRVTVSDVGPQFFDLQEIGPAQVLVVGDGNMTAEKFWARDTCDDPGALFN